MTYRCCRCGSPLQAAEAQQPWPCKDGCGEWLTREAVDAHLFPRVLMPLMNEPRSDAPRCAFCGLAMRGLHWDSFYHLCADHGIWFDKDDRQLFAALLDAEIAKHREARRTK